MATSGRIEGSYAASWANYAPYVKWSVTQSEADNRSVMSVTFGMRKTGANSSSYNLESHTLTLVVNGKTYTRSVTFDFRSADYPTDHDIVTVSGISIPHNADGTKSVSISATHPTDTGMGTGTLSGTAALTTIPRATQPTAPSAADAGTQITVGLPRVSGSFTHTLHYRLGSGSWVSMASGVGASYTWTVPMSLCRELTAAASGTLTIRAQTYSGQSLIGSKTVSLTVRVPSSVKPAATLTVTAVNDNAVVAGWGVALKGYTRLGYTVSADVSGDYGATVTDWECQAGGETFTAASGTTSVLAAAGAVTVRARVRDSRGRWSDYVLQTVNVLDYSPPVIHHSEAWRVDGDGAAADDGQRLRVVLEGSCAAVGDNAVTLRRRRRQVGGGWLAGADIAGTGTATHKSADTVLPAGLVFLKNVSYELELSVSDSLGNTRTVIYVIPTAEAAFHLKSGGKAAAFGKYAERDRELELAPDWGLRYRGDVVNPGHLSIDGGGVGTLVFDAVPNPDYALRLIGEAEYGTLIARDKETNRLAVSVALENTGSAAVAANQPLVYLPGFQTGSGNMAMRGVVCYVYGSTGALQSVGAGTLKSVEARRLASDESGRTLPIDYVQAIRATVPVPAGGKVVFLGEMPTSPCRSALLNRGGYDEALGEKICGYFLHGYSADYAGTSHKWTPGSFTYDNSAGAHRTTPGERRTDCSGMVYTAYMLAGLHPRDSVPENLFSDGIVVAYAPVGQDLDTSLGLPGDVICYENLDSYDATDINRITHVGLYAGNDTVYEMAETYPAAENRTAMTGPYAISTPASAYRKSNRARYLVRYL